MHATTWLLSVLSPSVCLLDGRYLSLDIVERIIIIIVVAVVVISVVAMALGGPLRAYI